jgi:hypothetical protein
MTMKEDDERLLGPVALQNGSSFSLPDNVQSSGGSSICPKGSDLLRWGVGRRILLGFLNTGLLNCYAGSFS